VEQKGEKITRGNYLESIADKLSKVRAEIGNSERVTGAVSVLIFTKNIQNNTVTNSRIGIGSYQRAFRCTYG
jgi:hypothetical protein